MKTKKDQNQKMDGHRGTYSRGEGAKGSKGKEDGGNRRIWDTICGEKEPENKRKNKQIKNKG